MRLNVLAALAKARARINQGKRTGIPKKAQLNRPVKKKKNDMSKKPNIPTHLSAFKAAFGSALTYQLPNNINPISRAIPTRSKVSMAY